MTTTATATPTMRIRRSERRQRKAKKRTDKAHQNECRIQYGSGNSRAAHAFYSLLMSVFYNPTTDVMCKHIFRPCAIPLFKLTRIYPSPPPTVTNACVFFPSNYSERLIFERFSVSMCVCFFSTRCFMSKPLAISNPIHTAFY